MVELSIIIPVFNSENYILKCLNSCLNQNFGFENYEIIVVDDGSSDSSISIIESLQKNYSNIVIFQKKNGGVSSARNRGVVIARGEYILFVDSDDTIEKNILTKIFSELKNKNHEVLILNSASYHNEIKRKDLYIFPQDLSGISFSGIELFKRGYQRGSVCGVLFKKQFITDYELKFSEQVKIGEDSLFMAMAFLHSSFVSHFNIDFYKVNIRVGSASRLWDYTKVKEMLNILNVIELFIEKNTLNKDQLSILNIRVYGTISNTMYHFFSIPNLYKYSEIKGIIKKSQLYPLKSHCGKQFKCKIYLLNFSIDLFCFPFLIRRILEDIRRFFIKLI